MYHHFFDRRGDCLDQFPTRENGETMYFGSEMQLSPERGSYSSLKAGNPHDSVLSLFPDDDSGFNSTFRSKSRSGLYLSDDYNISPRMNRSRSMTRLPMTSSQDLHDSHLSNSLRMRPFEHSLRYLKDNLDDSENRRVVLVHKLKEAQETLELQNDRLNRIEGTAKTNSVLVDDLKYKEKEYRDKINQLERSEDEKRLLKAENDRLRDEMQSRYYNRIDKLDYQLRSLQAQHQVSETENIKRSNLLEQSTTALSLLENENTKLKKDKDTLRQEILVAKEALELAREKFGPMENENRSLKHDMEKIKEENDRLSHKAQSVTSKLSELKDLTETMREENEKLASSWKQLSEEKQKLVREIDNNQENHREARARVTNLATERDRLFNEKMEMTGKIQQLMIDKEQVEKTKIALEEQIAEQEEELMRIRKAVKRKDEERRLLEETIHDSKNNYDELFKELSNVRAYYERSLEQISVLENNKQLTLQQLELAEHEKERLRNENDRLREAVDGKSRDLKNEREQLEEAVLDLKEDLRQMKQEKSKAENRNQELEIKLEKANESLKEITSLKQGEIDNLKSMCDRLSATNAKKETEIETLGEKIQQMEIQGERLRDELKSYKEDCEQLQDQVEDIKKLKDENRRLLQEKAENEQVIKLLETQKEVLSKSDARHRQKADSSMEKLKDIDKLTDKISQYRSENEHLRGRINELEKVRDNLIAQKEELLANSELIYKKPQLEELEAKIEELREANKQLREINEQVNEKADVLQQENATLKDAVGGDGSVVPRVELERLTREKERLQSELDHVRQEHENLEERHQRFIIQYGHEGSETKKDKETIEKLKREKEALEKTVALINGQMLLVEGGKKRLDDVVDDLQSEIVSLRQQLEEAEKKHQPEVEALQEEINILNEQLDEAKYEQDKQRRLIQTLKDESLDDVGTELRDMRDELHKLMGVIESKDHAIETLENQLRTSKGEIKMKEQAMSDLQTLVSDLEQKNEELKQSVDGVRHSIEEKYLSPRHSSPSPPRQSRSPSTRASRIPSIPLRQLRHPRKVDDGKELEQIKRSQSEKSGDRLQSLISKYRGYSDAGSQPERKIKPLSLSPSSKMGLVTKGRSFGPAAPKTDKEVSGDDKECGVKLSHFPLSSARVAKSDASALKSSPILPEHDLNKLEVQLESVSVEGQQAERTKARTEKSTGTDNTTSIDAQTDVRMEKKGDDESGDKTDGESDDKGKSDEEESDTEQRDIDHLIDSCYRTHLAFLRKLKKRGYRGPKGGKKYTKVLAM